MITEKGPEIGKMWKSHEESEDAKTRRSSIVTGAPREAGPGRAVRATAAKTEGGPRTPNRRNTD